MQINFKSNYNLDLLSFFNPLTSDHFYVKHHKEAYDTFYPLLSDDSKEQIMLLTKAFNRTNLAVIFITALSAVAGYEANKIVDTFRQTDAILRQLERSPYVPPAYLGKVESMLSMGINIVEDLENIGFRQYWDTKKKLLIEKKCDEFERFYKEYKFFSFFNEYKQLPLNDINVYICTFHHPHGTKLYFLDNNIILSDVISKKNDVKRSHTRTIPRTI